MADLLAELNAKQKQQVNLLAEIQPIQQPGFVDPDVPTEQALAQSRTETQARVAAQQPESLLQQALGVGEAALTLGTGATTGTIGNVLGTLDQIVKEIVSGEIGSQESAQRVFDAGQQLQQAVTFQPRTESGQDIVSTVGEVGEQLTGLAPVSGQIANIAKTARTVAPRQALFQATRAAKELPRDVIPIFKDKSPLKQEIAKKITTGTTDPELASLTVKPSRAAQILGVADNSRIVSDPPAAEAIRQGFDPGVIQPIKNQNKVTLDALKRMVDVQDRVLRDKEFGVSNRPGDVAGEVFKSRFDQVVKANRKAGSEINRIANQELAGQKIDLAPIGDNFSISLREMGITGIGEPNLNFGKSSIRGIKELQKPIKKIYKQLLEEGGDIDALGLHQLKRQIDNVVSFNSKQKGLSGDTERVLKNLRSSINNQLSEEFPNYRDANKTYSETIGIIDEVQRISGRQLDLQVESASKALGTLMRRLMSNAQSRVPLMNTVDDVNKFAFMPDPTRIGKMPQQVNLKSLILFADELDSNFGAAARTSLQGQFDQSLARNLGDLEFASTGSPLGVLGRVADRIKDKDPVKLKIRQSQAQKEASKAMRRFLNDQIKKGKK